MGSQMRRRGSLTTTAPEFDAHLAFQEALAGELAEYPPDTDWMTSGRPSKDWPEGETLEWWGEHGPEMVTRWMKWRDETPWDIWVAPDGRPGIELELLVQLDGEWFKVIIDRVMATAPGNERPIILDIKSGSRTPKNLLQLGGGAAALEVAYPGVRVAGGCFWMARTGEATGVESLRRYSSTYIGRLIRQHKMATAAGIYLPSISDMCKGCSVGEYCAANSGAKANLDPDYALMEGL